MTQHTVPEARLAQQRRPGARDRSSWGVPLALVALATVSAGWVINALVAEWIIRRPGIRRAPAVAVRS
jgi:hypothetical protein